ncbi:MAG: DUF5132 domain-containing protein [Acidobacteriota bacterium]
MFTLSQGIYLLAGAAVGPFVYPLLRPLVKEVVKGGVYLVNGVGQLAAEIKEEVEDIAAEATSEVTPPAKKVSKSSKSAKA